MKKSNDFHLVGHLQVMEEPLSSLYTDRESGRFFLFVRLFEQSEVSTYLLTQVTPSLMVDYMEGKVGLKAIFGVGTAYYYQHRNSQLCTADFLPLTAAKARQKLESDGLDDMFDKHLSYRMVPLKQYLKTIA